MRKARVSGIAPSPRRGEGVLGKNILGSGYDLGTHASAARVPTICARKTGLIESLEGKPLIRDPKPPYFPRCARPLPVPTIVNNVETLFHVKHIVAMGGAEYAKLGSRTHGTAIVSSG